MRAVVAGEEDDGAVVNLQFLELVQELADVGVQAGDHGRLVLFRLRPRLIGIRSVAGDFHAVAGALAFLVVRVGNRVGEVKEEGPVVIERLGLVDAHEIQRGGREQIIHVQALLAAPVFGELDPAIVARLGVGGRVVTPEVIGVVIVRMHLVQITEEFIKPLLLRHAGRVRVAQPPFADQRRVIAGLLEDLGHCQVLRPERHQGIAANQRVPGVQAGHQRAARRRANRAAGVEAGEAHAFRGQSGPDWAS